MMIQRLEICVELVKLAIEFVMVVAEAVGLVIHESSAVPARSLAGNRSFSASLPYVGFIP